MAQVERVRTEPVSEDELARIRTQLIAAKVYEKDSVFYQAMLLGQLETVGLGWELVDDYVERLSAVTPEQVQAVARKYLVRRPAPSRRSIRSPSTSNARARRGQFGRTCLPLNSRQPRRRSPGGQSDAAKPPAMAGLALLGGAVGASHRWRRATPQIETWQTDNGAKVLFVAGPGPADGRRAHRLRRRQRPRWRSARARIPDRGHADRGRRRTWSADAIAERIESVGAELGTAAGRDMAWASLRSLTEPRTPGTGTRHHDQGPRRPDFPAEDFERVRATPWSRCAWQEQDPGSVGSRRSTGRCSAITPTPATRAARRQRRRAITRDDLRAFHQRYYTAANATVAIVGALTARRRRCWPSCSPPGCRSARRRPAAAGRRTCPGHFERIDFPSSQTHLYMGQPGMRRLDPDYFPLYVGNHILGGSGLVSILMDEVREQRGLSYSTYSYFAPMASAAR
jgi:predicted Zn-dependent peptidase